MADDIVTFLRKRDYRYVRELGEGGCGKTVLLHEDFVEQHFVCKKFDPTISAMREELFECFLNEIKLMYRVSHPNVVRIFGHHVEEARKIGYIIMEFVEGETIDKHIAKDPASLLDIFRQTLAAFYHLENCDILHRDVRFPNVLVSRDGVVKVIDLGFGKIIKGQGDFEKSITLNWAFTPPREFEKHRYDFQTEVYFVGKMFERILHDCNIEHPRIAAVIREMTHESRTRRIQSFALARIKFDVALMKGPDFSGEQTQAYRSFADELESGLAKITGADKIEWNPQTLIQELEGLHSRCMLEESVSALPVLQCFLRSTNYRWFPHTRITVNNLKGFLDLLKAADAQARNIILSNLAGRLEEKRGQDEDEIPF